MDGWPVSFIYLSAISTAATQQTMFLTLVLILFISLTVDPALFFSGVRTLFCKYTILSKHPYYSLFNVFFSYFLFICTDLRYL